MIEVRPNEPADAQELLRIWRDAVDSSHNFLAPEDRIAIEPLVTDYVRTATLLLAPTDGVIVAFMGVTGQNIDSLFVEPKAKAKASAGC
jgi:putative acetyltransferase